MIALEIYSMKNFMKHLLLEDTFDLFLLEEATIRTANTYTIDGHINVDFFPLEERNKTSIPYSFTPWSEARKLNYDLIKGKNTPLFFKFILQLKPEYMRQILGLNDSGTSRDSTDNNAVQALVLNIRYDGTKAILTTGTSYRSFVMNRDADIAWDNALCRYLSNKEIGYEKL